MSILALTKTYLQRTPEDSFKDLVQGKGRGINFLLQCVVSPYPVKAAADM